ncbi:MAG: hypothetical protein ACREUT_00045 [Steroidobacteraceae bacterium]
MIIKSSRPFAALILVATVLAGCGKLHLGSASAPSTQLPTARELKRIRYMSQSAGPDDRRVFDKLAQARSCRDLEIAMRWNRPPDLKSGPFNEKLNYLTSGIPASLPKQSEVFIVGTIEHGQSLSSGGWGWTLKLEHGPEVQAIEPAEYWQKQEQAQQEGGPVAIVKPYAPGRKLCARGVYQGEIGRSLNGTGNVPLVSVLFSIDRRR